MSDQIPEAVALERRPSVEARTGLNRSSLYELMSRGEFPKPARISARAVAWNSAEVSAWIRERLAARGGSQ